MHKYPAIHNAMWPGLVGKGGPGAEPPIDLETMLDHTAKAEVNGRTFDGVDLFLFDPHVSIDSKDDDVKKLAETIGRRHLVVGSLVAPVWPPTGGGSAPGPPLPTRPGHIALWMAGYLCIGVGSLLILPGLRPRESLMRERATIPLRAALHQAHSG